MLSYAHVYLFRETQAETHVPYNGCVKGHSRLSGQWGQRSAGSFLKPDHCREQNTLWKSVTLNRETHYFYLRCKIWSKDLGPEYGQRWSHDWPVDVVVLMEMQQTRRDLKSHSLKSQEVPSGQVRGHPIWLALGSQIPLQVTLFEHHNINASSKLHAD